MSKDRAFESLFLENYFSFILTIECKEEFTLQGALSGHNQGKIAKKPQENQVHRRGGSKGLNEPPLAVNNGGLKTQTVDFQLLGNTGGMENKL